MNLTQSKSIYDPVDENISKPEEHIRTAIRRSVVAHLSSTVPEFENRIFGARRLPRDFSDFPGIHVYTESEVSEKANHLTDKRTVQVIIAVVGKAGGSEKEAEIQDAMDDFAKLIEDAMKKDVTLAGLVEEFRYSRNDVDYDDRAQQALFANKMEFEATYYHETPIVTGLEDLTLVKGDFQQSDDEEVPTMGVEQELPGANNDDSS